MDTTRLAQLRVFAWKAYTPEDTAEQLEITVKTAAQYVSQSEADSSFFMKNYSTQEAAPLGGRELMTKVEEITSGEEGQEGQEWQEGQEEVRGRAELQGFTGREGSAVSGGWEYGC